MNIKVKAQVARLNGNHKSQEANDPWRPSKSIYAL
jgi:hypothetical protein